MKNALHWHLIIDMHECLQLHSPRMCTMCTMCVRWSPLLPHFLLMQIRIITGVMTPPRLGFRNYIWQHMVERYWERCSKIGYNDSGSGRVWNCFYKFLQEIDFQAGPKFHCEFSRQYVSVQMVPRTWMRTCAMCVNVVSNTFKMTSMCYTP